MLDPREVAVLALRLGLLVTPEAGEVLGRMNSSRRGGIFARARAAGIVVIDVAFLFHEMIPSDVSVTGVCACIRVDERRVEEESLEMLEVKIALLTALGALTEASMRVILARKELQREGTMVPELARFTRLKTYLLDVNRSFQDDVGMLCPGIFEGIRRVGF
ncbi:MAG: hypothetical protein PHF51_00180 [Candidatus ainarchaeum sp.]|nr:hypothetical protein [Candidatus ainarchaeum sp.]